MGNDAKNQRAASQRAASAAFEQAGIGLLLIGARGEILRYNAAFLRMLGRAAEASVLATINDVVPFDAHAALAENLKTLFDGLAPALHFEQNFAHANGTVLHTFITATLATDATDATGAGTAAAVLVIHDIAARNSSEETLCRAEKMEAIGRLAGGIAHDFNNLLLVIGGRCDLLIPKLPDGDKIRSGLEDIRKSADRATLLTKQLLAVARRQMMRPQHTNLSEMLRQMEPLLRVGLGAGVNLVLNLDDRLHPVNIDPLQIQQVILTIVSNACDALGGRGGEIRIETRNSCVPSSVDSVVLSISDNGCGMDVEAQAHLFEPFYSTKEKGKNIGMGLAAAYGIVRQSSGTMQVESEPGGGALIEICFPKTVASPTPTTMAAVSTEVAGDTVLVVEDEDGVRDLIREVLASAGYNVLTAENGEAAIRLSRGYKRDIDMMISDVMMPGMNGREVAKTLETERPGMKVLFISGYTDVASVRDAITEAETQFLQKPFSTSGILNKVRDVLANKKNEK